MKTLIISLKIFVVFTILTGLIYPLLVTGIAQLLFYDKANGSLISLDNHLVGSTLIGQQFDSSVYFSSRPSAILYHPLPSGGSNYGLTNTKLQKQVLERKENFITANQLDSLTEVPAEMIFTSASGLDPHISPEAALLQVERIAKARRFNEYQKKELIQLIKNLTEPPQLSFLGENRINVFLLNLETDKIK
jgi:K+-transporting ATPase ATPase C chain